MSRADQVRQRREQLVDLVQTAWEENGEGPTRPELAEAAGLSVATVSRHIRSLIDDRILTEDYSGDRSLRLH